MKVFCPEKPLPLQSPNPRQQEGTWIMTSFSTTALTGEIPDMTGLMEYCWNKLLLVCKKMTTTLKIS